MDDGALMKRLLKGKENIFHPQIPRKQASVITSSTCKNGLSESGIIKYFAIRKRKDMGVSIIAIRTEKNAKILEEIPLPKERCKKINPKKEESNISCRQIQFTASQ